MNTVQNKINIIRKILAKIEDENKLTELFRCIDPNSRKDFQTFSPEQICFDLIKQIVDQDDLPGNVHNINVYMDTNDQILRYELISFASKALNDTGYINIIWEE